VSRRERQPAGQEAPLRRVILLTATLSFVATLVAVGALAVVLVRGADTGQTGQADPNACRTVTWSALPNVAELPAGWAIASTRFLVDVLTATFVGPVPSGSTEAPAAFVSISCYGSDAGLAFALDHEAARIAGSTDRSFPKLGDESLAVTSTRTSSTTVYVRRDILVADITASTSLDQAALETVAGAVDQAMIVALSASPRPSSTTAAAGSVTPSPPASPAVSPSVSPSPSPSPSATPVSHIFPGLEARLPATVDGTTMSIDSVTGATALGTDATSQALIAWLGDRGRTSNDLQIGRARDPLGERPIRLYAFRVEGVDTADLAKAIVSAFRADATSSPTASEVTLAGRRLTKVTYTQGPAEYLFLATDGVVFDIETTDESLVSTVLPLLK